MTNYGRLLLLAVFMLFAVPTADLWRTWLFVNGAPFAPVRSGDVGKQISQAIDALGPEGGTMSFESHR